MHIDDKGIVLRTVKYDDKSFIAHIFTASRGYVSFIVNSSRGKRAGATARLFKPLTFLSLQWEAKPLASLHRIKIASPLFVLQDILMEPTKRSIAILLNEFMTYALREETGHPDLYQYIEHSLRWLDTAQQGFANFHLVFLLKLTRFLGIAPNTETYAEGLLFDLTNACFTANHIQADTVMCIPDAKLLFDLSQATYGTMQHIKMNRYDRLRITRHLAAYYALHLPKFPVIHSLDVLRELYE